MSYRKPEIDTVKEIHRILDDIYNLSKDFIEAFKEQKKGHYEYKKDLDSKVQNLFYYSNKNKYVDGFTLLYELCSKIDRKYKDFLCYYNLDYIAVQSVIKVFYVFLDEVSKGIALTQRLLNFDSPISSEKPPKIFISHSSKDKEVVDQLVTLLEGMGLNKSQIFCSSVPGYGIPVGENICDSLRNEFLTHELYVIFLHSEHYYDSAYSLNEMGAAWALKNNYISFLLPGFKPESMKGVVKPDIVMIKLDEDADSIREYLNQFYDIITEKFKVKKEADNSWETTRDSFIEAVKP